MGRGDLQALTLIPKGRLRSIIWRCWVESPPSRPSFKELLATIEQDVSAGGSAHHLIAYAWSIFISIAVAFKLVINPLPS